MTPALTPSARVLGSALRTSWWSACLLLALLRCSITAVDDPYQEPVPIFAILKITPQRRPVKFHHQPFGDQNSRFSPDFFDDKP
jgi:hypothetical protein